MWSFCGQVDKKLQPYPKVQHEAMQNYVLRLRHLMVRLSSAVCTHRMPRHLIKSSIFSKENFSVRNSVLHADAASTASITTIHGSLNETGNHQAFLSYP